MQMTIKAKQCSKKEQISIRIDKDILEHTNELAKMSGYSRSEIINIALRTTVFKIQVGKGN